MDELQNGAEASRGDRDEILRKIGRNVLLFQQAERRLKWLAARKRIAGLSDEIEDAAAKMKEQVARETLGMVVRRAIDAPGLSAREQERIDAAKAALIWKSASSLPLPKANLMSRGRNDLRYWWSTATTLCIIFLSATTSIHPKAASRLASIWMNNTPSTFPRLRIFAVVVRVLLHQPTCSSML
jgi:hypothetical protein